MTPSIVQMPAFRVAGMTVRTRNDDERVPERARIGALWDRFFSASWERQLPGPGADGRLYGVYSAYESDAQGAYDVTAGVAGADLAPAGTQRVDVLAGDYLVFRRTGAMPQIVLDAWADVWHYFAQHPEVRRRFGTDFERYEGSDQVAIHIGVVAANAI